MQQLFKDISYNTSKLITSSYSTSFSKAVSYFEPDIRNAIYSIYGFVRLSDEIVDSFHEYNKAKLIELFERDYYEAYDNRISLNPALNSFQETVRKYNIPDDLIKAFLKSMKADLVKSVYISKNETDEYVYGSAEVVGLMCLKVFANGDSLLYEELTRPARRLGAAFQKVNFLRDIKNDIEILNRHYFHNTLGKEFDESVKKEIVNEIRLDFSSSFEGIRKLPEDSKVGVLIAYYYFKALLRKIEKTPARKQFEQRIRVHDFMKILILGRALLTTKLKLI
ncbi:MAG TPA: squalene/phytoene synthase family protein [Bacteroidales bacterium]|nr:squalene/phytoene synthase family protein [Bacteroidales bacterium]